MKRILLTTVFLISAMALYADEIHLTDGTVLKGSVIQITESIVEYDPEGPAAFDTVPRDRVARIKYDSGKVQRLGVDAIYLTGGEVIKCSIVKVTRDTVVYTQDDSAAEKTIGRDRVARLEFSDGKVIDMPGAVIAGPVDVAAKKQTGGYLDSMFRFSLFGGGNGVLGGVVEKERRVYRAYEPDLVLSDFFPVKHYQYTTGGTGGAEVEFLMPAIKFEQKRGFDFTGIKFGIRGRYGYEHVLSHIATSDNDYGYLDDEYMGTLMNYHYWTVGPGMSFVFTPRSNAFSFIVNMYGTVGQVFGGRLHPLTALRDSKLLWGRLAGVWPDIFNINTPLMSWANVLTLPNLNNTRVRGYTVRAGIGPEFAVSKRFPIIIGTHLTYAYTVLSLGRSPLMYADGKKKAAQHEVGAEISVGLHF